MHLKPFDHEVHSLHVGSLCISKCVLLCATLCALPVVSLSMPYSPHTPLVFALLLQLLLPLANFAVRYTCSLALLSILVYVTLRVPPWVID